MIDGKIVAINKGAPRLQQPATRIEEAAVEPAFRKVREPRLDPVGLRPGPGAPQILRRGLLQDLPVRPSGRQQRL